MTKSLGEQITALSMADLARLYDNMLERKIVNGTNDDPFAALLCDFILMYVDSLGEEARYDFGRAHDAILIAQFLGEE